ncbi:MAG: hypothetical protein FWC50_04205 [Planctomycetaceae bacterium]|nr:hypothetical protein [Planctomycetaceae bacterium]
MKKTGIFRISCSIFCLLIVVVAIIMDDLCYNRSPVQKRRWPSDETFVRKNGSEIRRDRLRDDGTSWSSQLAAAIRWGNTQNEIIFLDDMPDDSYRIDRKNAAPLELDFDETETIRKINALFSDMTIVASDRFTENVKRLLESALEKYPELFYAEYLLGVWYAENHEPEQAAAHFQKAFRHAEMIAVLPVMTINESTLRSKPFADVAFAGDMTVRYNTQQPGMPQQSELVLTFPKLRTDKDGLIFLPLYRNIASPLTFHRPAGEKQRESDMATAGNAVSVVETVPFSDIPKTFRIEMRPPVLLTPEQCSQLAYAPGCEEEFQYCKTEILAGHPLFDETGAECADAEWTNLFPPDQIRLERPNKIISQNGATVMPSVHYANLFHDLSFRGLTRSQLTNQLDRQSQNDSDGKTVAFQNGDNIVTRLRNGATFLCLFDTSTGSAPTVTVWDLGFTNRPQPVSE